jgi:hypothetical protein
MRASPGGPVSTLDVQSGITSRSEFWHSDSAGSIKARFGIGTYTGDSAILSLGTDSGSSVGHISLRPNGAEAIRLTSTQKVGIGTPNPAYRFSAWSGTYEFVTANTNGTENTDWPQTALSIRRFDDFNHMTMLQLGHVNDSPYSAQSTATWNFSLWDNTGGKLTSDSATDLILRGPGDFILQPNASVKPATDNAKALGSAANRWSVVYAGSGTINTSDARDKLWRAEGLTVAEITAAREITEELGFFKWVAAIAEKGKEARYHFGLRAQNVWAIMSKHGLIDPIDLEGKPGKTPYAFLCWDEWDEQAEEELEPGINKETEEDWLVPTGNTRIIRSAGYRYGLRLDQLALFMIAGQEARLRQIENQLAAD